MGPYTTPAPGRTPGDSARTRIVQREDYQLDVKITAVAGNQWRLQILRYMPETAWTNLEFYLTPDELVAFRQAINGTR